MTGQLVILRGPSGVGKDTVVEAWKLTNPLVERVVAVTTRQPREGETNSVDYHFVTMDSFNHMVEQNKFMEHENVHGNWYGTLRASVDDIRSRNKFAILKIDVKGALRVMQTEPDVKSVFLLPPSWEVLEERIRGRGTDDDATIEIRLSNARDEIELASRYTHQVVNDNLEATVVQLEAIVSRAKTP